MALVVNNIEVNDVTYNGVDLDKVICDGVVVFEKVKVTYLSNFKVYPSATTFEIKIEP